MPQTVSRSVQQYLQGSRSCPTDTTDSTSEDEDWLIWFIQWISKPRSHCNSIIKFADDNYTRSSVQFSFHGRGISARPEMVC